LASSEVSKSDSVRLGIYERWWRLGLLVFLALRIYLQYKTLQLWGRHVSDRNLTARFRRLDLRAARALYKTAVKLEGLLIKTCQFIGTRADVLPAEWVNTLAGLHDRVPPRPFSVIRSQIERELGRPLHQLYAEFNPVPLAAASLAQVHRARLSDGRECAVKVQYPGIEARVHADLHNLVMVLGWLAWLEPNFDFRAIIREMLRYVPLELDFIHEGQNCDRVRANFSQRSDVLVPEIYWELTTRRILTMEFMEGTKITDSEELARAGIDRPAVAQKLTEVFCEQILTHGFFHGDPHPGNLLVRPGPTLVLLDFGLAKDFSPTFRQGVVRLTLAILSADKEAIIQTFASLGFKTRNGSLDQMATLTDLMIGNAIKRQKSYADPAMVEELSEGLPRILRANPLIEIPADILLIFRVIGLLSGLGKSLDSQVNLMQTMMPYAQGLFVPAAPSPTAG